MYYNIKYLFVPEQDTIRDSKEEGYQEAKEADLEAQLHAVVSVVGATNK